MNHACTIDAARVRRRKAARGRAAELIEFIRAAISDEADDECREIIEDKILKALSHVAVRVVSDVPMSDTEAKLFGSIGERRSTCGWTADSSLDPLFSFHPETKGCARHQVVAAHFATWNARLVRTAGLDYVVDYPINRSA